MGRPWWREPFGLPPGLERRLVAQGARNLRPWEVRFYRIYLPLFPAVGIVSGFRYELYGTLLMALALPALNWLGLPDHQRRQVLGTRRA